MSEAIQRRAPIVDVSAPGAPKRRGDTTETEVWVVEGHGAGMRSDQLATEEPLEIRLLSEEPGFIRLEGRGSDRAAAAHRTVAITMRTPGDDLALAAGFLYGEGIVRERGDIRRIRYCEDQALEAERRDNTVNVELRAGLRPDLKSLERHFYTTSACGVCGKASLEALRLHGYAAVPSGPVIARTVLYGLPGKLQAAQAIFGATGGLHAAGLFDAEGNLLALREDVGRHNAVDKLVGWALMEGRLPLRGHVVMVSGRSSFEILQKCLVAGVPIVCAVSAPSSLAVALAREFHVTLIGFLRGERFNVYAGVERVRGAAERS
jgi:FdhD protein